jgi:hypothetical protein
MPPDAAGSKEQRERGVAQATTGLQLMSSFISLSTQGSLTSAYFKIFTSFLQNFTHLSYAIKSKAGDLPNSHQILATPG